MPREREKRTGKSYILRDVSHIYEYNIINVLSQSALMSRDKVFELFGGGRPTLEHIPRIHTRFYWFCEGSESGEEKRKRIQISEWKSVFFFCFFFFAASSPSRPLEASSFPLLLEASFIHTHTHLVDDQALAGWLQSSSFSLLVSLELPFALPSCVNMSAPEGKQSVYIAR